MLILVAIVVTAEGAVSALNTVRINRDQEARNQRIDSEICRVIARVPGDLRKLEGEIHCPVTVPFRLPAGPSPAPTVTVRVEPSSTAPAPTATGSAAGPARSARAIPRGAGPALTSRPISPRPGPTQTSTTPTPSSTPTPSFRVCLPLLPCL